MSKVLESMQNYLKPYYFSLSIVIVVIIFTIASYYSYIYFFKKEVEDSKFTDVANANNRNKTGDLYFFHVDWCPHCVKAKPEWNKFVPGDDESGEKMIKGYKINCRSIDCTNDDDLASKFKITSYPTIKLVLDGQDPIEFESKITKNTLETFVDTIIN
jgi:thiol-disulfide isomerase/thioredoxin